MSLPASPCVRNCCLNDDVCMGCYRHISEIIGWGDADQPTREDILARAQERARLAAQNSGPETGSPT